jgi:rRNA maturation RNase YbeY
MMFKITVALSVLFTNFEIMSVTSKVRFFYDGVKVQLRNREYLKTQIRKLFKREGKQLDSLNYVFCSDERLLEINRQYLEHDFYTDIITFDLSELRGIIQGEVYISIDRVRDNAKEHAVSIAQELRRVIFHGALHLCGYGDKSAKEQESMRYKEDEYLQLFDSGVPREK